MTISFEDMLEPLARMETSLLKKYRTSAISPANSKQLVLKMDQLVKRNEIFKEEDISLHYLANRLEVSENAISQSLSREGTNFHAWLSEKRAKHAIGLIHQGKHETLTLRAIAFESGFQSKQTFNRAF